jgi:hypothetical protein
MQSRRAPWKSMRIEPRRHLLFLQILPRKEKVYSRSLRDTAYPRPIAVHIHHSQSRKGLYARQHCPNKNVGGREGWRLSKPRVGVSESVILSTRLGKPKHLPNADHASLNGRSQQLCRVGHAHLFPVCFDRFDADLEPLAHFIIFETGPNQLEDFLLATGQGLGPLLSRWMSEVDKRGFRSDSRGSCHFIYSLN